MRTISSAKIRWDIVFTVNPDTFVFQLILLMMACCRHEVNSLGEMLSPCLAPLPRFEFFTVKDMDKKTKIHVFHFRLPLNEQVCTPRVSLGVRT